MMKHTGGADLNLVVVFIIFNTSLSGRLTMMLTGSNTFDEAAKGAEAMFDWNGNGREDWGDHYIDYQIFNDIYNSDEGGNNSGGNPGGGSDSGGCGCLLLVIGAIILFSIF